MIVQLLNVQDLAGEILRQAEKMKNDLAEGELNVMDTDKLQESAQRLVCVALAIKNMAHGQEKPSGGAARETLG